jgi:hypothetical protein
MTFWLVTNDRPSLISTPAAAFRFNPRSTAIHTLLFDTGRRPVQYRPMDSVAEAIDHVLHEVEAARFDLRMTRFRLQQAEALRRFDRAKVSVADLVQSRTAKKALAAYECIPPASTLKCQS